MMAQVTVLGIPRQGGGLAVHIVLLLRLFRMWRVIKLVEVRPLAEACAYVCIRWSVSCLSGLGFRLKHVGNFNS